MTDDGDVDVSSLSLPALIERSEELRSEVDRMQQQISLSSSTDLVHVSTTANDLKVSLAVARSVLMRKQSELTAVADAIRSKMEIERSKIHAVLAPMKSQIKKLEEGLWSVSLYLGAGEEIVQIADGDPADIDEPIYIRQEVLAMDEQMMEVWKDGQGLDARHIEMFDEWLLDPENLAAILPERRGVIVFRPRRQFRDYGNQIVNEVMGTANAQSYWLIRNGDRLWRMTTDIVVGERLVPRDDEYEIPFWKNEWDRSSGVGTGKEPQFVRTRLQPGDFSYNEASEKVDGLRRHFMRTTLVLQGLLDRTQIFAPLPVARVDLTDLDTYDSIVRIVRDNERVLADAHIPFLEWQRGLMEKLSVGMRVVGSWYGPARDRYETSRTFPSQAPAPKSSEIHRIEEWRNGRFIFKFERSDSRYGWEHGNYGRWGEWPYKNRASYEISPDDTNVIPIDATTITELERYLNWRTERVNYLSMVPLLKAAIESKKAEAAEEAPFRLLLAGEIAKIGGDPTEQDIDDLVHWWKLRNKYHRPLIADDPKGQAAAVKAIVTEWGARSSSREGQSSEAVSLAQLQREHPEAIAILRKNDGTFVVVERQESVYPRTKSTSPYLKVTTDIFGSRKGRSTEVREWQILGARKNRWRLLWSTDEWKEWPHSAEPNDHLTDAEIASGFAHVENLFPQAVAIGLRFDSSSVQRHGYTFVVRSIDGLDLAGESMVEFLSFGASGRSLRCPGLIEQEFFWEKKKGSISFGKPRRWKGRFSLDGDSVVRGMDVVHRLDSAEIDRVATEVIAPIKAENQRISEIRERGFSIYRATKDSLTEAATKVAKERFLVDYLDIALWPAHQSKISKRLDFRSDRAEEICKMASLNGIEMIGRTIDDVTADLSRLFADDPWVKLSVPEKWSGVVLVEPEEE